MSDKTHSPVSQEDIEILIRNGCRADDWAAVQVAKGFDAHKVVNTVFKGTVTIGSLQGEIETADGIMLPSSIFGANLNNVDIGDNCHIRNIHSWIMNMNLGEGVVVVNVGRMVCTGKTTFGNGEELEVLNEGGGRELKITEKTSAQTAYLNVMYRQRKELIAKLDNLAEKYAESKKSDRGTVGNHTRITNSGRITDVNIGEYSIIDGISSLENGTVVSSQAAPTLLENGVTAKNFIFQQGASIKDRSVLNSVLVGEGCKIGSQFSCEGSVFFANSEGFHSEAVCIFAGPYTVTHHKSTLLIAGLFSFYNAGSGTNQSNHMYKLGPVHQGILERGCKTGSFSYLLWPSRVGAFTAVIGKHYANFDVSNFPFSYIDDDKGKSVIIPGMNFFTVGTLRDGAKWPNRDRRTNEDKLDLINFDVLSPYTAQKMLKAIEILTDLSEKSEKGQEFVSYQGIQIKRLLLKTCKRYYKLALEKYFGDAIVKRFKAKSPGALKDLMVNDPDGADGTEEWLDICGLLCTRKRLNEVTGNVENGSIDSYDGLQDALKNVYQSYDADEWNWVMANYSRLMEKNLADTTGEDQEAFMAAWKKSSQKLYNMVLNDASKEFEGSTRLAFGIDGDADADFDAVRGIFEENSFVKGLKADSAATEDTFKEICDRI